MNVNTIKICGKQVKMMYCAATENGFEAISGKSINVFLPTFGKDADGNDIVVEQPKATIGDITTLAVAGIIAAYSKDGENVPINTDDILYNATLAERNELITSIVELRKEWYWTPKVVEDTIARESREKPKN